MSSGTKVRQLAARWLLGVLGKLGFVFWVETFLFSGWGRDLSCCSGFQDGSLVGIGRLQETQKPWKPCKL